MLELQVEPSDLGAVVCNVFTPIKMKVRDFSEEVTPKKEGGRLYSATAGMVQNGSGGMGELEG